MQIVNEAKTYHLLCDWTVDNLPSELQSRSIHKEAKVYIIGGEIRQKVCVCVSRLSMLTYSLR